KKKAPPSQFDPKDTGWVEIWNDVFMQFTRTPQGVNAALPQKNVDTGMGLERVVMVLNDAASIYDIDTFEPLMKLIDTHTTRSNKRSRRILADHIKAATFVLGDEHPVTPSNKGQGYVVRRLIRRAVLALRELGVQANASDILTQGAGIVMEQYGDAYPSLPKAAHHIIGELRQEVTRFDTALDRGIEALNTMIRFKASANTIIDGNSAFELYQTYGLPAEMTKEIAQPSIRTSDTFEQDFHAALQAHQEKSRTAAAGKFKGGLADHSKESIHYHTATHLLHQALRSILGNHVLQRGSNITPKRLRFDFSHPEKMMPEQIAQVEDMVNQKIKEDLPVIHEELSREEAKKKGALGLFEHKYGEKVSVYTIGNFSCEICGGPHVSSTGELGHFTITKEESAGAGVRRIKAILE
ncbi:MAG: alanine--tRNA ligase-related protein, partial [Acidobacteriota bacterium]